MVRLLENLLVLVVVEVYICAKDLPTAKNIVKAVEKAGAAHTWIENLGG